MKQNIDLGRVARVGVTAAMLAAPLATATFAGLASAAGNGNPPNSGQTTRTETSSPNSHAGPDDPNKSVDAGDTAPDQYHNSGADTGTHGENDNGNGVGDNDKHDTSTTPSQPQTQSQSPSPQAQSESPSPETPQSPSPQPTVTTSTSTTTNTTTTTNNNTTNNSGGGSSSNVAGVTAPGPGAPSTPAASVESATASGPQSQVEAATVPGAMPETGAGGMAAGSSLLDELAGAAIVIGLGTLGSITLLRRRAG